MTARAWAVLFGAYLLGSIPSAYLISRFFEGIDIRQIGDGNVGAKNTYEAVGRLPGLLVGLADITKGILSVMMARQLQMPETIVMLAGACAILGHDFSPFLGMRGGQGMAAMVGVFLMLFPHEMAFCLSVFLVSMLITRNWDLSWGFCFGLFPILLWLLGQPPKKVLYPLFLLPTIGLKKLLQAWRGRHAAV